MKNRREAVDTFFAIQLVVFVNIHIGVLIIALLLVLLSAVVGLAVEAGVVVEGEALWTPLQYA